MQSAKTRPGADCGSDHELLIAKFRLKLKKVGKTTRPFRYDLNQIPYDYTEEVRNWFKELDLIDRVPDELWMEVCDIVQETGIKTIHMEKRCKKAKCLSGEALQIAVKKICQLYHNKTRKIFLIFLLWIAGQYGNPHTNLNNLFDDLCKNYLNPLSYL